MALDTFAIKYYYDKPAVRTEARKVYPNMSLVSDYEIADMVPWNRTLTLVEGEETFAVTGAPLNSSDVGRIFYDNGSSRQAIGMVKTVDTTTNTYTLTQAAAADFSAVPFTKRTDSTPPSEGVILAFTVLPNGSDPDTKRIPSLLEMLTDATVSSSPISETYIKLSPASDVGNIVSPLGNTEITNNVGVPCTLSWLTPILTYANNTSFPTTVCALVNPFGNSATVLGLFTDYELIVNPQMPYRTIGLSTGIGIGGSDS